MPAVEPVLKKRSSPLWRNDVIKIIPFVRATCVYTLHAERVKCKHYPYRQSFFATLEFIDCQQVTFINLIGVDQLDSELGVIYRSNGFEKMNIFNKLIDLLNKFISASLTQQVSTSVFLLLFYLVLRELTKLLM